MAHTSVINRKMAVALDGAVEKLGSLLPSGAGSDDARDMIEMARRDVVASKDPSFQNVALVSALVEIVLAQQRQIDELRETLEPKGPKARSAAK